MAYYTDEDKRKKDLSYEELLELQALGGQGMLDQQAKVASKARDAQYYEKLANLAGKLGQVGAGLVGGKMYADDQIKTPDMTGALSKPLMEQQRIGEDKINRVMSMKGKLEQLKGARAKAKSDAEQAKYDREMKDKEFKLKEDASKLNQDKFGFEKIKTRAEFINKSKEIGVKAAAEARAGKLTDAQIDKMKNDMMIAGGRLGLDKQKLALAADKFGLELFKASQDKADKSTIGQEAADRAVSKDYSEWASGQPQANFNKSMAQLDEVIGNLASGENLTGFGQNITPEFAKGVLTPKSKATRDAVLEIVQRNLREVLGAAFTAREGDLLMARAFDETLSEEENIKRVRRLKDQLQQAMNAKEQQMKYFEENGTLKGFTGPTPKSILGLEGSSPVNPTSNTVRVRTPSGKIVRVPSDRLNEALEAGGERVE